MNNLVAGITKEIKRNMELLQQYESIGAPGMFGAAVLREKIDRAQKAVESGDIVEMTVAYADLKKSK